MIEKIILFSLPILAVAYFYANPFNSAVYSEYASSELDAFYQEYKPHTVFIGRVDGDRMYISLTAGIGAEEILGYERPYSPRMNQTLNTLMDPNPHCIFINSEHIYDDKYRTLTEELGVTSILLCPLLEDEKLAGFVGVYMEDGDERDLLEPLKELSESI